VTTELQTKRIEADQKLFLQVVRGEQIRDDLPNGSEMELQKAFATLRTWDEYNQELLRRIVTSSQYAVEYMTNVQAGRMMQTAPLEARVVHFRGSIDERNRLLESLRKRLLSEPEFVTNASGARPPSGKVFIVHGHASAEKHQVARFLHQVTGEEPVILHEAPSLGKTLIEKLEHYAADVGFAVILLTGDDMGRAKAGEEQPRARQNVVLELGYFIGLLDRDKVAVLYENGVESPGDMSGVLYVPLDEDWRFKLGAELKAAGYDVDLNKATS
jgi:predicted nucleotide-binding protein